MHTRARAPRHKLRLLTHAEYNPTLKALAARAGLFRPTPSEETGSLQLEFEQRYLRFARAYRVAFLRATEPLGEEMQRLIWAICVANKQEQQTVDYADIEVSKMHYSEPKRCRTGGGVLVPVSADMLSDDLTFQLSLERAPFGVRDPYDPSSDPTRKTIGIAVSDPALAQKLAEIDEMNKTKACENSPGWLGEKKSRAIIDEFYRPIVTPASKEGYDPIFKCKFITEGDRRTKVYVCTTNDEGEIEYRPGDETDVKKGIKTLPIVRCSGMWFMSKQFGMSFTASSIMVFPERRAEGIDEFSIGVKPRKAVEQATPATPPQYQTADDSVYVDDDINTSIDAGAQ